ncbi:hypothetical protein O7635_23195 [Asanoa sp. WMMD1127]|uniref:hypothetical protein n=1 Tax=Asanoa sp. WMMD1127 TaxID=3016107 RepID=UPI002416F352|nr:hypothetical protein [Asanoa sp. WMMD1127]MDG4824767.1 hypothetical protein [Asanoa sp. WMMD1127]
MRRIASTVVAGTLALGALLACSATDDPPATAPEIGLTPGPGVSILSRPTPSRTTVPRAEPGDGTPPLVFGDCVIETSRSTSGVLERINYGERSCREAMADRPNAWKVVNLGDRAECPDDDRHITFTISPLLPSSTSDYTYVCAERL